MNSDVLHGLPFTVALVTVGAVLCGALVVYEKTKRKSGNGGGVSSADSFSDVINRMDW